MSTLSKMATKSHSFGRDSPVFREPLLESADKEFVPIVHYKMSKMESGSLTRKDGAIFSLTARDLEDH